RGLLPVGAPSDAELGRAIRAWQRSTKQKVTGVVDPGDAVWIRAPITPSAVLVKPGDDVRPELPVFGGAPALSSARITGGAAGASGAQVFVPDAGEGSTPAAPVPVDARGAVSDLPALAKALPAGTPRTARGIVRLARPIDVFAVPATSVVSGGGGTSATCVVVDGRPATVRVVDTDVDGVLVTGALAPGSAVLTAPAAGTLCGGA
ncbi:MAG TPA: hypothetical protein VE781_04990, partial [Kineosporiaceae bacterium]|nr:hypothetical protein [Kineosporiaceae bacterium]